MDTREHEGWQPMDNPPWGGRAGAHGGGEVSSQETVCFFFSTRTGQTLTFPTHAAPRGEDRPTSGGSWHPLRQTNGTLTNKI